MVQRRTRNALLSAAFCAAAALSSGAAQAAIYSGNWDPAYGASFAGLGWKGTATFFIPDTCLASSGWIANTDGCAGGEMKVLSDGRDPYISADSRFVVFTSKAPDVLKEDVYLFDREAGFVRRISVDSTGARPPAGWSGTPSISGDGRLIAFASTASLRPATGNPAVRVYVRDTLANTTNSVAPGWRPAISANGRYVAFASAAVNLVPNDRNNLPDVFLADLRNGSIELVSRGTKGGSANGASTNPAVSGDGRFVAFQSEASDMVCASGCPRSLEDINLLWDVFLFDRESRTMARLSSDPLLAWLEESNGPAIDARGSVVAFSSRHPINANDNAHDLDLFIRQLAAR